MMPSKGYFSNILCPYSKKECSRPYCHYRHCKEDLIHSEEDKTEEVIKEVVKKTVAEVLSCRQIKDKMGQINCDAEKIINIVLRDIENRKTPVEKVIDVPCYNPTPISELNKRHIPVVLPPTKPSYAHLVRAKKVNNPLPPICQRNEIPKSDVRICVNGVSKDNEFPSIEDSLKINVNVSGKEKQPENSPEFSRNSSTLKGDKKFMKTSKEYDAGLQVEMFQSDASVLKNNTPSDLEGFKNSKKQDDKNIVVESTIEEKINDNSLKSENLRPEVEVKRPSKRRRRKKYLNIEDPMKNIKILQKSETDPPSHLETNDSATGEKRRYLCEKKLVKKSKHQNNSEEYHDADIRNEQFQEEEVIETISIHSSSCSSPEILDEKSAHLQESPPPKRKRSSTSKPNISQANSQEALIEKWRKAREIILFKNKSNGKFKIHPVANVQILLKEKVQLLERKPGNLLEQKPDNLLEQKPGNLLEQKSFLKSGNQPNEKTVVKSILRKSRIPAEVIIQYPNPIMESNLKIPYYSRQQAIKSLYDEFRKYRVHVKAYENSQKLELELCRRVHIIKTYKNAIAVALFRIRKQKGIVFDKEAPKEILASNKGATFTNGWTLYKCFSEYLLTNEQYRLNGYPMRINSKEGCAYIEVTARRWKVKKTQEFQQVCDHCSKTYFVDNRGFPLNEYDCFYHWGKLRRLRTCGRFVERYTCCGGDIDSDSCTNGKYHVCNLFNDEHLEGFVTTLPQKQGENSDNAGIYGIDCEMCYTTKGIELTRITLVDLNGNTVYDKIVVPDNPIIDYCTRFSGITEDIIKTSTLKLQDIQKDILRMINENTILVGHSIENDMKVLRIFHKTFVDTSVVFPHKNGLPFKLSLKKIAKDLLDLTIQEKDSGHDSYEDANACVQIMLWKVKEDAKIRKPRTIISVESKKL